MHVAGHAAPAGDGGAVQIRAESGEFGSLDAAGAEAPSHPFSWRDRVGSHAGRGMRRWRRRGRVSDLEDDLFPAGGRAGVEFVCGEVVAEMLMFGCEGVWGGVCIGGGAVW